MSKIEKRRAPASLANISLPADELKNLERWSQARGPYGDPFQRHILKPFIAAYAKFRSEATVRPMRARRRMRAIFSEMLAAIASEPDNPETILSAKAGSALSRLAVLDLGCGEAFLGRWIVGAHAAYLGIDREAFLLERAEGKAREAGLSVPVRQADITGLAADPEAQGLPSLGDDRAPNLVTMTGVVDHLENYRETMKALAQWADADGNAPDFIVATLNPFFFKSLLDLDLSRGDGPEVRVPVRLAVSESNSEPFLRWPDEYERTFVDAGFHVLTSLSPSIGQIPALRGVDLSSLCGRRDAVDEPTRKRFSDEVLNHVESPVHVGPFILWLLRPRKRAVALGTSELLGLASSLENARDVEPLAAELGRLSIPSVPVLVLGAGDPIEHAGGLGGHCYVVLGGTATRWQQKPSSDPVPVQLFETGDLFGEFEAGLNAVADRFKDDVTAGDGGCRLVVLERPLINQLLARERAELTARLFLTLRRRMSQYSWTWIPAQVVNSSESVLSHVARAILFGLSHEAQRRAGSPRLGPPVIIATPADLARMIYGRPAGEDMLKKCLNKLVREGVIDYGTWTSKVYDLHHSKWAKELAHDVWKALIDESSEIMLGEVLPKHLADQLMRKKELADDKISMLFAEQGDIHFTQQAKFFMVDLFGAHGPNLPRAVLQKWLANLAAAQGALYCQARASMLVRDVAFLREIANCPDVAFRTTAANLSQRDEPMEEARWVEYADATVSHIIGQLRENGRFRTTGAAVGISPDVSAILMRDASANPRT